MSLSVGARLGPYEITGSLGVGGMGEVYRARDTELGREVALKVLPADVHADPDRLARFQREAQVLASLNHPGIAAIHGLERTGGVPALVLELVEGETLADRLVHGALALDETVQIVRQIADALEVAHGRGIVHRDLKPANVKVRPDGTVKVLDFGLAKAIEPERTGRAPARASLTMSPTVVASVEGNTFWRPATLFDAPLIGYDVAADGRFLGVLRDASVPPAPVNVVVNWFDELKRLVPSD